MTGSGLTRSCIVLLLLVTGGCATGRLDRMFAGNQYLEVVQTFEADSTLHVQERALYLAGVSYAMPDSPAFSPDRALQIFDRLLGLYPSGRYAEHSEQLRQLLRQVVLTRDEERLREREFIERESALATARAEIEALQARLESETERADGLQTTLDRLNLEIQRRGELIAALEAELEALKGIDLNRPR